LRTLGAACVVCPGKTPDRFHSGVTIAASQVHERGLQARVAIRFLRTGALSGFCSSRKTANAARRV
jgi:hypothetical protein